MLTCLVDALEQYIILAARAVQHPEKTPSRMAAAAVVRFPGEGERQTRGKVNSGGKMQGMRNGER